ncbi:hypothetical protein [Spirillospora sp. CA-128828]|uniref:hypothetical protein n=1 Tax=Spirillospora sp. CA-128828 TaxID=3240033 RepID=UPI003D933429
MFQLSRRDQTSAVDLLRNTPELAEHAAAGYITYQLHDGQPTNIKLAADVAFSLDVPINIHDTLLPPPRTTASTHGRGRPPAADPSRLSAQALT